MFKEALNRSRRALARHPVAVALTVAAVAFVLAYWVAARRRTEGWTATGENEKIPKKVRKRVAELCETKFWTDIKNDDKYKYLAKYDETKLWQLCQKQYADRDGGAQQPTRSTTTAAPKPTPTPAAVKATQPVVVSKEQAEARAAAGDYKASAAGGPDNAGSAPFDACYYYKRSLRHDDVWECSRSHKLIDTGEVAYDNPLWPYQCAQTEPCKKMHFWRSYVWATGQEGWDQPTLKFKLKGL